MLSEGHIWERVWGVFGVGVFGIVFAGKCCAGAIADARKPPPLLRPSTPARPKRRLGTLPVGEGLAQWIG